MKAIRRSRRVRSSRRRRPLTHSINNDTNESDVEYPTLHEKSILRSNKNANRMPTSSLFETIPTIIHEDKQHEILQPSIEQSSFALYSIDDKSKPKTVSDDLTSLTKTATNTTALTTLTTSNTKQTETVKINLTQLSSSDILDSSSAYTDYNQSSSWDTKLSEVHNQAENTIDLSDIYETDTSMRSIIFSKEDTIDQVLSCFTIPTIGNDDFMTLKSPSNIERVSPPSTVRTNIDICQRPIIQWNPRQWHLPHITSKCTILISFSSLSVIIGILILVIVL